MVHTCAKRLSICIVTFSRLANDYELGDVNVSLFTVQLRCAFIHFRIFSLTLKQMFLKLFSVLVDYFRFCPGLSNRSPDAWKYF